MSEVPVHTQLSPDALARWGVSACLRYIINWQGGTWTAERAVTELRAIGWETTSRYPLNMAGNMLNRLCDLGALESMSRGVYTVNHDVLGEIISQGIREFARAQRNLQPVSQVVPIAPPS